ncbi:MAG: STAS domain-containing protein [Rhodospirillales bacterium]|nr:STAS domain-containing protein [Rhodospirillales bacterium]
MRVDVERVDGGVQIKIAGSIHRGDQQTFLDLADQLDADPADRCVFDLAGLDDLDGVGMGMLLFLYETTLASGKTVNVRGLRDQVARIFAHSPMGPILARRS